MDDLISRQAAIDVLTESLNKIPMINNTTNEMIRRDERITCIHEIIRLPSADRTSGEWLARDCVFGVVYCSECGYELRQNDTNYCPNCGCRMKGADDE